MEQRYWSSVLNNRIGRRRAIVATGATALGAAFLAGLGAGVWTDRDLARLWKLDREFEPVMSRDQADDLQARWRQAVDRSLHWALPDNQ